MATGTKQIFDKVIAKLDAVVSDLSTIEVTTISGDISLIFNKKDAASPFSFADKDALMNTLGEQAALGDASKIYIVAYSRIDFDQDTVNFVKSGLSDEEKKLYEVHINSLKAAQEARAGFVKMLTGLVGGNE